MVQGRGKFPDGIDYKDVCIIALGAFTMYRSGDIRKMKWSHFFDSNGQCKEFIAISAEVKTYKGRTIMIADRLKSVLEICFNESCDDVSDYILPNLDGKPMSQRMMNKRITMIAAQFRMKHFSTHSLRKAGARQMYDLMGADFEALMHVQLLLNHANPRTTMRYIGITDEKINRAIKSM